MFNRTRIVLTVGTKKASFATIHHNYCVRVDVDWHFGKQNHRAKNRFFIKSAIFGSIGCFRDISLPTSCLPDHQDDQELLHYSRYQGHWNRKG